MNIKHKRILALLLLAAMVIGAVPSVLAVEGMASDVEPVMESSEEPTGSQESSSTEPEEPQIPPPEAEELTPVEEDTGDDDVPRSMDGETLTRDEELLSGTPIGISLFAARAATATVSKSTCVNFSQYTSPTWYCNRYYTEGTHTYGHYFYASTIAYHKVSGEYCYCIEPNTTSLDGQTYTSYDADSASSTSFWMRELDSTQRELITKILACGYPQVDYGYTAQQQYAATQTLIWEVCCKTRYASGIRYCTDYGMYSNIYAVLGDGYQKTYDGIIENIAASTGTVPSFAGSSAKSITLTYNSATDCYEGSVTDSNAVLSYFTFSYTGVTFTKSGNTLKISVPASSASSVKGKTITGTSTLKDISSCNPSVWENSSYQTVLSNGSASNLKAYISLTWTEPSTPTPEPEPEDGALKIIKQCSDSSVSLRGWKFSISISGIGTITRTTNSSGIINVTAIPAGSTCTITETNASGYKVLSSKSVTISEGQTSTVTFTNQPLKGNLTVTKGVNYGTLSGFTFRLYGTSTIGKFVDMTATTDSSGKATFTGVYVGTYTLEEVDPGSAYIKPASTTVTISANSTTGAAYTSTVNMDNVWKHWYATITKVDAETGQSSAAMAGAEYTLYKNGSKVDTYTVGNNGTFVTDNYPCTDSDGVYTLKETKAPEGYQLDSTEYKLTTGYSHYSAANNHITLTVSDEVINGKIQLEKYAVNTVTKDKQPEQGAAFEVYAKSAGSYAQAPENKRDIITIGADGKGTSKDLAYGTYCIHQTSGWEGYDIDETIYEAAITTQGEIVTKDVDKHDLTIENNIWLGTMTIQKVDGDTKEPLAGAEFTLTGSDGSEVVQKTGSDGKVVFENLTYGVTYTWTETKSPKGYLLDESNTGTWSVSKHDDTVEITAEDQRRPGSIVVSKQDMNGEPLAGVTFLLEYKDSGTWKPVFVRADDVIAVGGCSSVNLDAGCLTTDESGTVTFEGLWADEEIQYRLTEVAVPEGYELLSEPVYEGTLPVTADPDKTEFEPDEILDGTAYFYTLPVTVQNGEVYTLPMTGGRGFPFVPLALVILTFGAVLCVSTINPYWYRKVRRYLNNL